jgi:hypothetical protein
MTFTSTKMTYQFRQNAAHMITLMPTISTLMTQKPGKPVIYPGVSVSLEVRAKFNTTSVRFCDWSKNHIFYFVGSIESWVNQVNVLLIININGIKV